MISLEKVFNPEIKITGEEINNENYVAYHNTDSMGYSVSDIDFLQGYHILSNKSYSNLIGSRVWLIAGEGSPKKYNLGYTFLIDEIVHCNGGFKYKVKGKKGLLFKPPILLNDHKWFKNFKKTQGNFGLGLSKIHPNTAKYFLKIYENQIMNTELIDIKELKEKLAKFATDRDWDQFHSPKNLVMALSGEVGELNELFQWLSEVESIEFKKDSKKMKKVKEEIADIFIYLVRLAHKLDIDIKQAVKEKIKVNSDKYPISLSKGNAIKYNDRDA